MLIRNFNFTDTFAVITFEDLFSISYLVLVVFWHTHHIIFIFAVLLRIHYRGAVLEATACRIQVWLEVRRVHLCHFLYFASFSPRKILVLVQTLVSSDYCCCLLLTADLLFSKFAISLLYIIRLVFHQNWRHVFVRMMIHKHFVLRSIKGPINTDTTWQIWV